MVTVQQLQQLAIDKTIKTYRQQKMDVEIVESLMVMLQQAVSSSGTHDELTAKFLVKLLSYRSSYIELGSVKLKQMVSEAVSVTNANIIRIKKQKEQNQIFRYTCLFLFLFV